MLTSSSARFFDYEPFDALLRTENEFGKPLPDSINERMKNVLNSNPPLVLMNTNPADLRLLYNEIAMKEQAMKEYNSFLRWAKGTADQLMIQIKEEYHMK